MQSIFKKSVEIRHSHFLNIKQAEDIFTHYLDNASMLACYEHLKGILISTLHNGYSKSARNQLIKEGSFSCRE